MSGMHAMLVHFPLAFWALATLMILTATLTGGRLAAVSRTALLPVLILGLLGALAGLISGWMIWPSAANLYSPLTRSHILMALWSLGIFTVITLLIWRGEAALFDTPMRWLLSLLALFGGLMFAITGTLGGHLASKPTAFSDLLEVAGWKVYETFYAPDWALITLILLAILAAVAGFRKST